MLILPLSSPSVTLDNAGGKGASLSRLIRIGQPVPDGFILTTAAYRLFVSANHLEEVIAGAVRGLDAADMQRLEEASTKIRRAFSSGRIPAEIETALAKEWAVFGAARAAVRSSATTEDLPELSFAGQQDTFLNVQGEAGLRRAVVNCWSSLWTARAIGYRLRAGIPDEQAALAVVVQQMAASDVSGVLFTANPLTGLLSESVIDAAFGLGEALVSGKVEPDHYVVDSASGEIRSLSLGAKQVQTRAKSGGGVEEIQSGDAATRQTLTPEQVRQLTAAGQEIQKAYKAPQDIEWAFAAGNLVILQSRPITSLFPAPRASFDPLSVWFSLGAFQGMVGPMTPLGQEAIQRIALAMGNRLGVLLTWENQDYIGSAGERLWLNITGLIRNPLGSRLLVYFLGIGEPGTSSILRKLLTDRRLGVGKGRLRIRSLLRALRFFWPALVEIPGTLLNPEKGRARFDSRMEAYLQTVSIPGGSDRFEKLSNFTAFMAAQGGMANAFPVVLPRFMPMMAGAMASLTRMSHLLPPDKDGKRGITLQVLDVTRGLPRNVTTEMDLMLWQTACTIKADDASREAFAAAGSAELAASYQQGSLPSTSQAAVQEFMDRYGMRGTGEIDLGQPRWREDPTPVMEALKSYLQISPEFAPDVLFEKNARAAGEAVERMAAEVRRQRGGRLKEKLVRGFARRVRVLLGARETPKFTLIRATAIVRNTLLGIGEEFVSAGTIEKRDDLFFLHVKELQALAQGEVRDWKALIQTRRQVYEREKRRRQVPRVLVSDGRAFYEGVEETAAAEGTIAGSPVSPGVAEGNVRVVLDPRGANLAPGEILVCPGTDPAWTPLFMSAGGLVMEVGGMMTHGSVVAREFGIPAVVGVQGATTRLITGQRIRLDGNQGKITVL